MFAGIDVGSVTSKAVVMDRSAKVLAVDKIPTTYDRERCGRQIFDRGLEKTGATEKDIDYIVATGYGRKSLGFAREAVTEIMCHAEGTKFLVSGVRTIIDIGGQDSKVIELDDRGFIHKFQINDKCAAGTGRFLEVLSTRILDIEIAALGPLALKSADPCILSSVCTVFAESEIVSYLSAKRSREDIALGLSRAISKRVVSMGRSAQIKYADPVCFSGGVALNVGVVRSMEKELGKPVIIPENPQVTAALGAALIAIKKFGPVLS